MEGEDGHGSAIRDGGCAPRVGCRLFRQRGLLSAYPESRKHAAFASWTKVSRARRSRSQRKAQATGQERKENRRMALGTRPFHRNKRAERIESHDGSHQQLGFKG